MIHELLKIENLDFFYPLQMFQTASVRDIFISAIRSPWNFFTERKKTISILENINLSIVKGDRLAILGVNGSGKTTLCRCIAGLLEPSQGKITKTAKVGAVIQTEAGFFSDLTGRENAVLMSYFLYPMLTEQERVSLVSEVIEFSGLGSYADATLDSYSSGMKARLSLSLTTALPTDLLILDEAFNNVDEFFQKKSQDRIRKQIEESGAVIMISHHDQDLLQICNRGMVLNKGKLVYDGKVNVALKTYRLLNGEINV